MNSWRFFVPGDPVSANRLWRVGRSGRPYKTQEAGDWEAEIGKAAMASGVRLVPDRRWEEHIHYRHRHPEKCLDLGNVEKAVSDALQGVAWGNDHALREILLTEEHDAGNPGLEITVTLTEIPYGTRK